MSGFIEGDNRHQSVLFPERLGDYIAEDNAVRVIDVFIDELDISGLGFKTIANFRKDNGEAIRLVCRELVMLCSKLNLFADAFVAIDGSKFKAVNNRDRNFTKAKMQRRLQQIDESVERYLGQIASADRQETAAAGDKIESLEDKISALKQEMERLKKLELRMLAAPDRQISLTDPDARSMATTSRSPTTRSFRTATTFVCLSFVAWCRLSRMRSSSLGCLLNFLEITFSTSGPSTPLARPS